MFLVSCYSPSYIWEISGCKLHLVVFSASKEANWTSKCPLHSHICLSSTLTFYSSISRCRFHLDVDSSLPRFLPVLSWRAGKRKNLDRQKQNLFQQVRDRGGLLAACVPSFQIFDSFVFICAIPGNVTITQIPDPDYCFSSIISPNPH